MHVDQGTLQLPEATGIAIALHHERNGIGPRDRKVIHHAGQHTSARLELALLYPLPHLAELEQGVVRTQRDPQRVGSGLLHITNELPQVLRMEGLLAATSDQLPPGLGLCR